MMSMSFWLYFLLALAYLFAVVFVIAALQVWWENREKRLADELADQQALRSELLEDRLSRYVHRPGHACGYVGSTNAIHIDARCIDWTRRVGQACAEIRRQKLREALRKIAEKKNAGAPTPASNSQPLN